jgi:uncharacterized protein GlcG (DUF336 family)
MLAGKFVVSGCFGAILSVLAGPASAAGSCGPLLPTNQQLRAALQNAVNLGASGNGGFGLNMWATVVDNSGIVCAVAFSGANFTSQWLGSRVISAQKANTGNAFSLSANSGAFAISSANLYSAVQPGGSLYGLQASNPVDTDVAYGNSPGGEGNQPASAATFGTTSDPLVGQRVGGINVFGGGLALYYNGARVGGIGVSGDTSCTDHMVAWRTRHGLMTPLDGLVGVSGPNAAFPPKDTARPDNIIFDIPANNTTTVGNNGVSANGWGHPMCFNNPTTQAANLPAVQH